MNKIIISHENLGVGENTLPFSFEDNCKNLILLCRTCVDKKVESISNDFQENEFLVKLAKRGIFLKYNVPF